MLTAFYLIAGLAILTAGAEGLVRGSSRLAAAVGISPLVIGLTIVAYGTSTPELVVSIQSGLAGFDDVAVANVVGSNIFNVLFILGICAMILPLHVSSQLIRLDVPIMIGASILAWIMAADGRIGTIDGLILSGLIVAYTTWSILKSRKESKEVKAEYEKEYGEPPGKVETPATIGADLLYIIVGLALLILGARWFVFASVEIAKLVGVSDLVIGLTIVAMGTSLPELATSIVATYKGERDIAIGNVVGSNIYNLLAICGIASLVTKGGLQVNPAMIAFDIPVMTLIAVACLPIFFTGMRISRLEGALFFGSYVVYTIYLVMTAVPNPVVD